MQAVNEALNGAIGGGQYDRVLNRWGERRTPCAVGNQPARPGRLERAMTQDTFIQTLPTDPLIAPVIEGLFGEYRRRYGDYFGDQEPEPLDLYARRRGLHLLRAGAPIAMGAFKRYDAQTAELKRIWTRAICVARGRTAGVAAARNAGAGAGISPALSDHRLSPARSGGPVSEQRVSAAVRSHRRQRGLQPPTLRWPPAVPQKPDCRGRVLLRVGKENRLRPLLSVSGDMTCPNKKS